MDERFRRAGAILGDAAMKKLSESRVAVLGSAASARGAPRRSAGAGWERCIFSIRTPCR